MRLVRLVCPAQALCVSALGRLVLLLLHLALLLIELVFVQRTAPNLILLLHIRLVFRHLPSLSFSRRAPRSTSRAWPPYILQAKRATLAQLVERRFRKP